MNLHEKILLTRRKKKISQGELSRKSGIAKSTISRIEAGKTAPTLETLSAISKALGTTVSELIGGTKMITDFTPDRLAAQCNCCGKKLYIGEKVIKYDGEIYCDTECLLNQLESDEVIEMDFELGGESK